MWRVRKAVCNCMRAGRPPRSSELGVGAAAEFNAVCGARVASARTYCPILLGRGKNQVRGETNVGRSRCRCRAKSRLQEAGRAHHVTRPDRDRSARRCVPLRHSSAAASATCALSPPDDAARHAAVSQPPRWRVSPRRRGCSRTTARPRPAPRPHRARPPRCRLQEGRAGTRDSAARSGQTGESGARADATKGDRDDSHLELPPAARRRRVIAPGWAVGSSLLLAPRATVDEL